MEQYKTLLAFDFGTKRIGVAFGQAITKSARPLLTLKANCGIPKQQAVESIIEKWHPEALLVGIPVNMDGTEQNVTLKAHEFRVWLERNFNLPVITIDERLTTVAAREQVFATHGFRGLKKADIDSIAAQIMLQAWFRKE